MASPAKTGSSKHEIVARFDQTCWKCRGKCIQGSRIWWDKSTGAVEHVSCPPVVSFVAEAYRPPPVGPDLWKKYCQAITQLTADAKKAKADEEHKQIAVYCTSCGMEWSAYANLDGKRHFAMANKCGGTWMKKVSTPANAVLGPQSSLVPIGS